MHYTEALERLMMGNRRYVAMRQIHPRQTTVHRETLIDGQNPFAAILSCSDSRVPSELIFDQGLGDLFIVRTAGHAANDLVLASIEFAVHALKVPLVMVMGHAQCGAVSAVFKAVELPGHLPKLVTHLRPALAGIDPDTDYALEAATRANTRATAAYLVSSSTILMEAVQSDRLKIAMAYYHLESGRVDLFE
ncbi:MAG: carbonic anhydrase [Chloroflexota bacterium]|nr:carbonic anhydrase [Chloroflexota bacterium]